jgi:penicillin-binding protein 1A
VAQTVGLSKVIDYARRFGISARIPAYLPIALGAVDLTLIEQTSAYSAFPNDGIRSAPSYLRKVTDYDGRGLEQKYSEVHDVVSERTSRIMTSMLREVVLHGTAAAASRTKYSLAGKTGTTNNFTDAWFVGFSRSLTCGVWVGFDEKKSLGKKETGARAALPIWMQFMNTTLQSTDRVEFPAPPPEIPTKVIISHVETAQSSPPGTRLEDEDLARAMADPTKHPSTVPFEINLNPPNH